MIRYLILDREIRDVGLSGEVVGEEVIQKAYILLSGNKEGSLMYEFLSTKPVELDIDRRVIADARDLCIIYIGDAVRLYDKFEERLKGIDDIKIQLMYAMGKKFLEYVGIDVKEDIIKTIGDQIVLFNYGGEELRRRNQTVVVMKLKDSEHFKRSLYKIEEVFSDYLVKVESENYKGVKIDCVKGYGEVKMCYMIESNYFYLAMDSGVLKQSIDIIGDKRGSIVKDIRYSNCKSKVPKRGNFILYSRGTLAGRVVWMNELKRGESDNERDIEAAIRILRGNIEKECGEISYGRSKEDGFAIQSYFPLSYIYVLEILFMQNLLTTR
jgi:hypothetical protein